MRKFIRTTIYLCMAIWFLASCSKPVDETVLSSQAGLYDCYNLLPTNIIKTPGITTNGTPGRDVIQGTEGNDIIYGFGGDDVICGFGGADRIFGGDGNDTLNGGPGNDFISGEAGMDTLTGAKDNDEVYGGRDNDSVSGFDGDDLVAGGLGNDYVNGEKGNDQVFGEAGDDEVYGGMGDDSVSGFDGNDLVVGQLGNDYVNGEKGNDRVFGEEGDDTVYGGMGDDVVIGGLGNDKVFGQDGTDVSWGDNATTTASASDGNDYMLDNTGQDTLNGGGGNDELSTAGGSDTTLQDAMNGGSGIDICKGAATKVNCEGTGESGPVTSAPVIGITPGPFTPTGGTFEIAVSPLDAKGKLITGGVTLNNFSFTNVQATAVTNPTSILSTATVQPTKLVPVLANQNAPTTLVIDFDSSGSMSSNDKQRLRVTAGKTLVDILDASDQAAILDFGAGRDSNLNSSRLLQNFSSNKTLLKAAIDRVTELGGTPLYASLLDALNLLKAKGSTNNALVVLTDGQASNSKLQTVITQALAQKVPIFTIGLGNSVNFTELPYLAQKTGGTFAAAKDAAALNVVFGNIGVGISQGRIVVTGTGQFAKALPSGKEYIVSGILKTTLGGNTVSTPFSFRIRL